MKLEDKELLFKDLCARLPYSTLCYCKWTKDAPNGTSGCVQEVSTYLLEELMIIGDQNYECQICEIKPYLRPMSSMTDEEKEELKSKCFHTETEEDWEGVRSDVWGIQILDKYDTRRWDNPIWSSTINMDAIDWLNAHHFDYRGLIEKGLAIAVTEEKPL